MNNKNQSAAEYLKSKRVQIINGGWAYSEDGKWIHIDDVNRYGELVRNEYAESLRSEDIEDYLTNNSFTHETECYFDPKEDYVNPLSGTISHNYKSDTIDVVSIDIAEIYSQICYQHAKDKAEERSVSAFEMYLCESNIDPCSEQWLMSMKYFKQKLSEG